MTTPTDGPMTYMQMVAHVTEHFVNTLDAERFDAAIRAAGAIDKLIEHGVLRWNGEHIDGERLYLPAMSYRIVRVRR